MGITTTQTPISRRPRTAHSTRGSGRAAALCAKPKHVDEVARLGETVFCRDLVCPGLHGICFDLYGETAIATNEVVVVVAGSAGAIERLALVGLQRIGFPLDGEVGESTVDGGESDWGSRPAETRMKVLGAHKAGIAA